MHRLPRKAPGRIASDSFGSGEHRRHPYSMFETFVAMLAQGCRHLVWQVAAYMLALAFLLMCEAVD